MNTKPGLRMLSRAALLTAAAGMALFASWVGQAQAVGPDALGRNPQITVMTRNLYQGANLGVALSASTPQGFIDAATAIFESVKATDFKERAEAIADEIFQAQPDLIGLQEVALWRSRFPSVGPSEPNATNVELDFLEILLDALKARGLSYSPVAIIDESDLQSPAGANGQRCDVPLGFVLGRCRDIRLTDRDVILARTPAITSQLRVINAQTGIFVANASAELPGFGTLTGKRGWAAVDVLVPGHAFRFITAHLDPDVAPIQMAQAAELLAGPANTSSALILVCDCNSPADGSGTETYANLVAAGLRDAWTETARAKPGYTCCQDGDLLNVASSLTERIDLIWLRGNISVLQARVVGNRNADRTPSGLWPSDHAGVFARVSLGSRR
jgi:endonuclease/exonuclease/phosphatase family metal-dependent hydrolase